MTFRRIDSYATEAPDKLADQLSRLEDNITSGLAEKPAVPRWTDWVSSGNPQLSYERLTRLDTSVSALSATLPSLSASTAGVIVGVKRKGVNNAVLYPVESTALIDGATSVTLGSDGLYLYVHDGTEWSRY